jgi:hypothetical protein
MFHTYKAAHQILDVLGNCGLFYISGVVGMTEPEDTVEMIVWAKIR